MYVHFYYHIFLLLIERHGVNRLFSQPILVPDLSGGEKLKGTAYIRHIHQPVNMPSCLCLPWDAGSWSWATHCG